MHEQIIGDILRTADISAHRSDTHGTYKPEAIDMKVDAEDKQLAPIIEPHASPAVKTDPPVQMEPTLASQPPKRLV